MCLIVVLSNRDILICEKETADEKLSGFSGEYGVA